MTISREDIRNGYVFILGREPEGEGAIITHSAHADVEKFRDTLLQCDEFRTKYMALLSSRSSHPYQTWDRETTAFIHIPKTGGTTLHNLLKECFTPDRVYPERIAGLHLQSPASIARYDLFSGHFDYFSLRFIPRRYVRRLSIFRDPYQRLISWYRFCKSHPTTGPFQRDIYIKIANELSAEEFFEHPLVISSPLANAYVFHFGSVLTDPSTLATLADEVKARALVEKAKERIISLDAIGITESFPESVELIFNTLRLTTPRSIPAAQVTDELPDHDSRLSRVPQVAITPRLTSALDRLTRYDRELYDTARREFNQRRLDAAGRGS